MKLIGFSGKKGAGLFIKVDDQDYHEMSRHVWHLFAAKRTRYAHTTINKKTCPMHRLILGLTDHRQVVDHIDYDGLNNQRANLRVATHSTNMFHCKTKDIKTKSSQYKGVCRIKGTTRWQATIRKNRKLYGLGHFDTAKEAALAYDMAAREKFGEFALTNFSGTI